MTGTEWHDDTQGAEPVAGSSEQPTPADPVHGLPAAEPDSSGDCAEADPAGAGWPASTGSDTVDLSTPGMAARHRRTALVVAAAVTVAVVAGAAIAFIAGSGSPQTAAQRSPAQVLAAVAHNSNSIRTLSATYSEQIGGPGGATISGSVQEVRKPLLMAMHLTEHVASQTVPLAAIFTDNSVYMKFSGIPGMPRAIAGKWLEFSLAGLAGGSFATLIHSFENQNPVAQAQLLLAAGHVRVDGTEVLGGVRTTRYTGSITPSAALKMLPASARAALAPGLNAIRGDAHFSIWIDGKNQIRQLVEHETVSSQPVSVTITFQSVNQPVHITIPPADQVLRIPASAMNGIA
jgi:hypothetical protein